MEGAEQRRVAVVDDDHAVRASLRFLLEGAGHVVETFESGVEFLETAIPNLACLILDNRMPHMTGLEVAERLRAEGAVIQILLITGSPSADIQGYAAKLGIRILEKPLHEKDLLDFVNATRH